MKVNGTGQNQFPCIVSMVGSEVILWMMGVMKRKILLLRKSLQATEEPSTNPVKPADVDTIHGLPMHFPRLEGKIESRVANGDLCFVKCDGDAVSHYTWVSLEQHDLLGTRMFLAPHQAYIHDVLTAPDYRRKGIAGEILYGVAAYLAAKGVDSLFVGVYEYNSASLAMFRKLGFTPIGEIVVGKALKLESVESILRNGEVRTSVLGFTGYGDQQEKVMRNMLAQRSA